MTTKTIIRRIAKGYAVLAIPAAYVACIVYGIIPDWVPAINALIVFISIIAYWLGAAVENHLWKENQP